MHLQQSSRRRTAIMHLLTPLPDEQVKQLNLEDAEMLKKSRKAGHPTPFAATPGPRKGPKQPMPGSPLALEEERRRLQQ